MFMSVLSARKKFVACPRLTYAAFLALTLGAGVAPGTALAEAGKRGGGLGGSGVFYSSPNNGYMGGEGGGLETIDPGAAAGAGGSARGTPPGTGGSPGVTATAGQTFTTNVTGGSGQCLAPCDVWHERYSGGGGGVGIIGDENTDLTVDAKASIVGGAGANGSIGTTYPNGMMVDNGGGGGGGAGIATRSGTLMLNGSVAGGGGGSSVGYPGGGGDGVTIWSGNIVVNGQVTGGKGGDRTHKNTPGTSSGNGGSGISIGTGTVVNNGLVQGGSPGTLVYPEIGRRGNVGVALRAGHDTFVTNKGRISSADGTAVLFETDNNTLALWSGSDIIGNVRFDGAHNQLVLGSDGGAPATVSLHGGDLDFGTDGVYTVRVTPTAADRLDVVNAARLNGAAVQVDAIVSDLYAEHSTYTILHAGGTFLGTRFGAVTSNLAYLTPTLTYSDNDQDALLTLARKAAPIPTPDPVPPATDPAPPVTTDPVPPATDPAPPVTTDPVPPATDPAPPVTTDPVPPATDPIPPVTADPVPPATDPAPPVTANPVPPATDPAPPVATDPVPPATNPAPPVTTAPVPPATDPAPPVTTDPVPPATDPAPPVTTDPVPPATDPIPPVTADPVPPATDPAPPVTANPVPPATDPAPPVATDPVPPVIAPVPPEAGGGAPSASIRFADLLAGRNAIAVADAVEALPSGHELYRRALNLPEGAPQAYFAALAGELHVSVHHALPGLDATIRQVPLAHLRANLSAGLRPGEPIAAAGLSDAAPAAASLPVSGARPLWAQAIGNWRRQDATDDTAAVRLRTTGLFVGADHAVGTGWRLGGALGYTDSQLRADGAAGRSDIASYSALAYGGKAFDAGPGTLNLMLGASLTWHDIDTRRRVAVGGLDQTLRAGYRANTTQVFTELGYALAAGNGLALEPYAGLAWADLRSRAFQESGGSAALSGTRQATYTTTTTLGLRAGQSLQVGSFQGAVTAGAGWRRAFGDLRTTSTLAFDTGSAFTVTGAPIARNAALLEAGLQAQAGRNATVALNYAGQFGSGNRDHSATLSWRWAF